MAVEAKAVVREAATAEATGADWEAAKAAVVMEVARVVEKEAGMEVAMAAAMVEAETAAAATAVG